MNVEIGTEAGGIAITFLGIFCFEFSVLSLCSVA
jgi:hypothetical protein